MGRPLSPARAIIVGVLEEIAETSPGLLHR